MDEKPCDNCGALTPNRDLRCHGYRVGDTEETVERWVCPDCDQGAYDEAMSTIGDYY